MGPWSMTVRWRTGGVGLGASTGRVGEVVVVDGGLDFLESERLMVPLGLTRPVPATRPPVRARMVPFLLRERRVGASDDVFGSVSHMSEYVASGARMLNSRETGELGG